MNALRLRRLEAGQTIAAVSVATALAPKTIRALERGATPQAPTAKKLAEFYGVEVSDIWADVERGTEDVAA